MMRPTLFIVAAIATAAPAHAGPLQAIRTALADWMYMQTEVYLDHGVAYRPIESGASEAGHPMATCSTVIPDSPRDYRGVVGRLHRMVHPSKDPDAPHEHAGGLQLVSWFRLMTWVDPTSVRGYATGSHWLESESPGAAMAFLDEGVQRNPDAFQVHFARGSLYLAEAKYDSGTGLERLSEKARRYCDLAIESYRSAAELTIRQRPATEEEAARVGWSVYDDLDSRAAVRMAVILERRFGSLERALSDARRYLAALGEDPVLPGLIADYEAGRDGPDLEIPEKRPVDPHAGDDQGDHGQAAEKRRKERSGRILPGDDPCANCGPECKHPRSPADLRKTSEPGDEGEHDENDDPPDEAHADEHDHVGHDH